MCLKKIGVFIDGNYLYHVSNYYFFAHSRKTRISISGIQNFICQKAAELEKGNLNSYRITDSHYFRGRISADAAQKKDILYSERAFDDILMREGIKTHYLPIGPHGGEKGVDVSLALEAFEITSIKNFDIVALVASDGDYIPLVRKLQSLGARVMLLGWSFQYTDDEGGIRNTGTSQRLLREVAYPLVMSDIVDKERGSHIEELFVTSQSFSTPPNLPPAQNAVSEPDEDSVFYGTVAELKQSFGFIESPEGHLFFSFFELNVPQDKIKINDRVSFIIGKNDKGICAKDVRLEEPVAYLGPGQ